MGLSLPTFYTRANRVYPKIVVEVKFIKAELISEVVLAGFFFKILNLF